MRDERAAIKGRGAAENPKNRFERAHREVDPDGLDPWDDDERPSPRTEFLDDASRSIVATNDSPDIPFEASINPYRGCEHGCIYCYARPTHEFLGYSAGLDFETKILVKRDAPALLRRALEAPSWKPQVVAISGVTDAYQPVERRLRLTRGCLEVLAEFCNPVGIVTKNKLVARDADLLAELARHRAALVFLSITTLDAVLARSLEPRASQPGQRLAAVEALATAGVPVGVLASPIIPGLTDHELPAILKAAAGAGACFAGYQPVRLPLGVGPLFEAWLDRHAPGRKEKILARVRSMQGGHLNSIRFGERMRGTGPFAEALHQLFVAARDQARIPPRAPSLSADAFRRPGAQQLRLFE